MNKIYTPTLASVQIEMEQATKRFVAAKKAFAKAKIELENSTAEYTNNRVKLTKAFESVQQACYSEPFGV
jgi:hypothetical protein